MNGVKKLLLSFLFVTAAFNPMFAATEQPGLEGVHGLDDDQAEEKEEASPIQIIQEESRKRSIQTQTDVPEIKNVVNNKNGTLTVTFNDGSQYTISKVILELTDKTRFDVPVSSLNYASMLKVLVTSPMHAGRDAYMLSDNLLVIHLNDESISSRMFKRIVDALGYLHKAVQAGIPLFTAIQELAADISQEINAHIPLPPKSSWVSSLFTNQKTLRNELIRNELSQFMAAANSIGGSIAKVAGLVMVQQFETLFSSNKKTFENFTKRYEMPAIQEAFMIVCKQNPYGIPGIIATEDLIDWGLISDSPEVRARLHDDKKLADYCFNLDEIKGLVPSSETIKPVQVLFSQLPECNFKNVFREKVLGYVKNNAHELYFQKWLQGIKDPELSKIINNELIFHAREYIRSKGADLLGDFKVLPESRFKMALRFVHTQLRPAVAAPTAPDFVPLDGIDVKTIVASIIRIAKAPGFITSTSVTIDLKTISQVFPENNVAPYLSDILSLLEPMLQGKKVVKLSLAYNNLEDIPATILVSLPFLKKLDLTGNNLTQIPACLSILQQKGVEIVGLEKNRIEASALARFKSMTPALSLAKIMWRTVNAPWSAFKEKTSVQMALGSFLGLLVQQHILGGFAYNTSSWFSWGIMQSILLDLVPLYLPTAGVSAYTFLITCLLPQWLKLGLSGAMIMPRLVSLMRLHGHIS